MKIIKHEIKNYRNIENICFEPDENINVLYGENGHGKTNIIESIWLFTGCNSFRTRKNGELIKEKKIEEIIDADGDGMPEQVNLTDTGMPMPTENIGGSYANSGGSFYYGVNSEWKEVWIPASEDTTLDVNITGENTFNIFNSATGKTSPIDLVYDPSTGKAHGEYKPNGIKIPVVYDAAFTANDDGHISINIITNWGDTPMLDFHGVK